MIPGEHVLQTHPSPLREKCSNTEFFLVRISSVNVCYLVHFFIGSKEFPKTLYHVTFLVYFDLLLKKNHASLYLTDCINKSNFYKNKKLFKIDDIDIDKRLVSKKESYGTKNSLKYFIGYNDDDVIRPLCIRLPQMIGYVKCFDSNETMSFKVSDNKLLKKYNKIWERVSNLLSTKFDCEPVYGDNDKYIKTKIKLFGDKINTNFQGKKIPKENASYKCLSLIMLDCVISSNKKYPQNF